MQPKAHLFPSHDNEGAENERGTAFWNYAKEIEPIEVTLEDIAKWKGVSKEQIIIK